MDMAREPSAGAAITCRQAERSLRRRDRLSYFSRTGQERDPHPHAEVGLGRSTRTYLRTWAHRRREKLRCVRVGAEGMPRWILGTLYARSRTIPRSEHRARRRQFTQLVSALE